MNAEISFLFITRDLAFDFAFRDNDLGRQGNWHELLNNREVLTAAISKRLRFFAINRNSLFFQNSTDQLRNVRSDEGLSVRNVRFRNSTEANLHYQLI